MHASAFLIRETKSGRRFARFFPLRIFMELVIREERFWNFYGGIVARRHSLGFFQKRQKWKILIFRFCRYRGFRGEAPNAVIGFFPMVKCALRDLSDKTEICITFAYPAIAIFVFWRLVVTKIIQLIFLGQDRQQPLNHLFVTRIRFKPSSNSWSLNLPETY